MGYLQYLIMDSRPAPEALGVPESERSGTRIHATAILVLENAAVEITGHSVQGSCSCHP